MAEKDNPVKMTAGYLILEIKDLSNRMEKQVGTNISEKPYTVSAVADVSQDGAVVSNLPCMV